ncbi:MAG: hypothetical protein ABIP51_07810, partial [Bacteroidia bacterium]
IPSSDPMSKGSYTIFGKKHNLEITEYMFQYCLNNIKMFFNDYWETVEFKEKKNMKKRAFYQGAVTALTVRLRRQKKESEQEHGIAKMNSLVKYNDAAVDKKVSEFFPKLTKGRTIKQCTDTDAINKGYKAGQVLNLSKGISETGEETKRLN